MTFFRKHCFNLIILIPQRAPFFQSFFQVLINYLDVFIHFYFFLNPGKAWRGGIFFYVLLLHEPDASRLHRLCVQTFLTVFLSNSDQHYNEVPIMPDTLCRDVVELCKEPGEADCYLAEIWRGSGEFLRKPGRSKAHQMILRRELPSFFLVIKTFIWWDQMDERG